MLLPPWLQMCVYALGLLLVQLAVCVSRKGNGGKSEHGRRRNRDTIGRWDVSAAAVGAARGMCNGSALNAGVAMDTVAQCCPAKTQLPL